MKKQNRKKGMMLRKALALVLAAASVMGMLPMESVQASRLVAVSREEIDLGDRGETEKKEEEKPQETQAPVKEEKEQVQEVEVVETVQPTKTDAEELSYEKSSTEEILTEEILTEEISTGVNSDT